MLFNSYFFIFSFLPLVLIGVQFLIRNKYHSLAIWGVGAASLVFYSMSEVRHLIVLLASILVNFFFGQRLESCKTLSSKRMIIILAIALNLLVLFFYKYLSFFLEILSQTFHSSREAQGLTLPIGISFFTFTQFSYLVDTYKEKTYYKTSFKEYLAFVTFFPHLVAGPILRHHSVIPQLQKKRFGVPSARVAYFGIAFFSCGLFKKVLIADNFSGYVALLFDHGNNGTLMMSEAWMGALLIPCKFILIFRDILKWP